MQLASALRQRTLWVGLVAVLVPLAALLILQYRWLVKLDHTSAIAHQATLDNYLEAVAAEVKHEYGAEAERLLNVPLSAFTQGRIDKAASHFKKKGVVGAKRLFVVSFVNEHEGQPLYFDPSCASLLPAALVAGGAAPC